MAENLHFAVKLDNEALKKDAKESQKIIKGVADEAIVEGDKMEKSFNRVGGAVAALFTAQQASKFIRSMVQIRGEFQQLEIAFTTMLKSGEKADKLMADLTKFAGETPFGLQSSANAARQLIAYGSAAETVIDEMRMLGDVAAGTGQQIGDLVYLYGTLRTQGKAYTMDIRQFAGRGIPIYEELAKVMGVAKNEINDLVKAGKIGFEEVQQAFKNMASSGGMYGGLMEKQSKSVTGRIEELTDAIDVMFNEIGKSNEGITYKVISTASTLVENYEKVGKIIAGLISTYGAYRAAVIVATIAEKGWTVASMAQYKWLLLVEKAQKLLNATMFKNPYVAITAAVVALVSSLIIFKDRTSDAEKAQERLNETLEKARERKEAVRLKGNELITTLKSETATVYQQIKAYRELISLLPELKGKSMEEIKAIDSGDLNRMISEREDQVETQALQDQYNERIKNIEGYRNKLKELSGKDSRQVGGEVAYYTEQLNIALKETKLLKGQLDEIADIEKEAFYQQNPGARMIDLQSKRNILLEKEAELLEKIKQAGDNDLASANDRIQLEALRNLINENQVALDSFNESVETVTKNKNYWQSIIDDATGERDMLGSDDVGSDKWNELTAKIKEATAQLSVYTSKTKEVKEEEETAKSDPFIFDVQREEGLANIQKQVKDFFDARRKANLEGVAQERKAEEDARIEYLLQWGNFEEKRIALIDKYELEASKAKTKAEKDGLLKSLNQSLQDLTSEQLKKGGLFEKMFGDVERLSTDTLNDILGVDEYIDKLGLSVEETKIFKDAILDARKELEKRNPFTLLSNSWSDFIKNIQSGDKDAAQDALKRLEKGVADTISYLSDVGSSVGSIFSSFGNDRVGEDINNIIGIVGGVGQAGVGIGKLASGDIIGGVKDLAKGISNVVGGIVRMNDAVKEREIQKLQSQLEVLEESYNNLSKAIDKAYSGTAANLIRENEKLLQQQKAIIQKQLEAEKSKKKTDKDAVKRYEQAIKDIDEELSKVEDSIVDVIFGDGVQSAIAKFSQAYADAFIAGEDAAEASAKVIENLIKGALVEAMKGDLANLVDDWMKLYSNYISDGIIDSYEQSRLDSLEDEMNRIALKHKKGFDRFVEKEEEEVPEERQGAKKGFATASQDSINELNGRFTALQQTASYIQIDTGQISTNTRLLIGISQQLLIHLSSIDKNTSHLEVMKSDMKQIKNGIDDINLKGVRIR